MWLYPQQRRRIGAALALASLGLGGWATLVPDVEQEVPVTPEQAVFFETKIRPVFAEHCFSCHGPKVQMAGLRLDTRAGFLKGTDTGKSLISKLGTGPLLEVLHYNSAIKMPPAGKLKPEVLANLDAWVRMGAPWPDSAKGNKPAPKALWSLMPVSKPSIPAVKDTAWPRNAIDRFVLAKLEAKSLKPNPEADRRTLLRRLSFDLIGLPPTADEVAAFIRDRAPDAYEQQVERLLASPHYGERWARHWLDVARYADTKGYVFEEDRNYPHAYTYRNWVIQALNRDLPYDQFIRQQLAADRLSEVADGDDKTPLAAMGFLTVGRRFLNQAPDIIDDRIDVTMRGFQGFTVACARCHDHKFDPIPTQDYYSLYSIFNSSAETFLPISERNIRDPWVKHNDAVARAENERREVVVRQTARLRTKIDTLPEAVKRTLAGIREEAIPDGENLKKIRVSFDAPELDRLIQLETELSNLRKSPPPMPELAMAMVDRSDPGDVRVFRRGNPAMPGDVAPRRFLAALLPPGKTRESWTQGSGRLELANAIASKDNPLTARVFVNRVWHHHFGAGIVRTPSDFGHQGDRPTHPELLDYLASTFMEKGWSIKQLHRLIVTSATYRQTADLSAQSAKLDPDNRLLGRMNRRRLDLEQMRDALLFAARRLDLRQVGGKSVDLWKAPFVGRRAVYGFVERQNLPGIFRTFDFASPDSTNPRRFQTTVPQQALFLMNSPLSMEQARLAVNSLNVQKGATESDRVRRLYRQVLGRSPDSRELEIALRFVSQPYSLENSQSPWSYGYGQFLTELSFQPLSVFGDGSYRPTATFPDPKFGFLLINGEGGHPGNSASHSVIRRWTAPRSMLIRVEGGLYRPDEKGNGVRARVVKNKTQVLGEWQSKAQIVQASVDRIQVQKGDTLDFIVDPLDDASYDSFAWHPVVREIGVDRGEVWDATAGFGPPREPSAPRLALLAQALMMANEFMFVD